MESEIREARNIMVRILRNRSLEDPLSREDVYRLLILYREVIPRGEDYLDWWWDRLQEGFSGDELELLEILHQAIVYRAQEDESRLQARSKQREAEVSELLQDLEEEIQRKHTNKGDEE
jgi:hypothetical protein